jgi:hypothetical protein
MSGLARTRRVGRGGRRLVMVVAAVIAALAPALVLAPVALGAAY